MRAGKFTGNTFLALASATFALTTLPAIAQSMGPRSIGFGTAIHGVPPSVTSFNFGGQPGFHGVPTSVTSLGFGSGPFRIHQGPFGFHHRRNFGGSAFFGNVIAVPYAYPVYVDSGDDDYADQDYRGGPTIFDRRGPGRQIERRASDDDYRASVSEEPVKPQEVTAQPRTVLVFKDGHQVEILNYAIVGATLFDLTDGRAKKVALAELDLSATVKQNDDRGVEFQVPPSAKLN